jgi:hypothetical protein
MSDIIFKTDGKEKFRIPFPTPGTKCPETKLEIKMTEPITLNLTLEELKLIDKYVEKTDDTYSVLMKIKNAYPQSKSPVEEAYKDWCGEYPSGSPSEDARWDAFLNGYWTTQPKAVPVEEPYKNVRAYWDKKDNPASYITDEVVDRLVKKYQAQKLWNRVRDELGYSVNCCDEIVDTVAEWLPKEQISAGSQSLDTELLVDGFNDCVRKMKEMLR